MELREARDAEEATAEAVAETEATAEVAEVVTEVTAEVATEVPEVVTDPPEPKVTDLLDRNELFEPPSNQ